MLQGFEDGVYMDNSVYIVDEKKHTTPLLIRTVQMFFILFGTGSAVYMLREALAIPCDIRDINLALFVFSIIVYGLCLIPNFELVKLFFGVLFYGLFLFSRGKALLNGFYILENLILERIDAYYEVESFRIVADYMTCEADITLLMIMLLIPIAAILALSVMRNRFTLFSGSLLLIPVAASFALGIVPSERNLVTYVLCTTYLISQSHSFCKTDKNQKLLFHKISSKAAIWLCLLGWILFNIIKLFVTQEEYNNLTKLKDANEEMQTAIRDFTIEDFFDRIANFSLFTSRVTTTGLDGGRLESGEQIKYRNEEHLRVIAPTSSIEEGIYLKGYVGSIYTGERWIGHSEVTLKEYEELKNRMPEEMFQPVNQVKLFLKGMFYKATETEGITGGMNYRMKEGRMEIKYNKANKKFLYAPYFANYDLLENIYYDWDLYAAPENEKGKYEYEYYYDIARVKDTTLAERLSRLSTDGYINYEAAYRDFVYKAYTKLPENGLENIKRDFSSKRVQTKTGSVAEKIEYVRQYLEENTRYSLSPGKLPEGKDYAEYFLYENRKGYCAHYATTAVLMLRAMGIPARYAEGHSFGKDAIYKSSGVADVTRFTVEGSKVNKEALSEVSVKDYHAHAWVEVYFDYCGWYPVEFTPGSFVSYNQTVIEDIDLMGQEISEAVLLKDMDKAQQTHDIPEQYQPIEDDRLGQEYTPATGDSRAGGSAAADLIWITIVLIILVTGALISIIYLLSRGYRNRYKGSRNRRAFTFYQDIEKMLRMQQVLPGKKTLLEEQEAYVKEYCNYLEAEELDRLMELVRRARFGRKAITEEELAEIMCYRRNLYHKVNNSLAAVKSLKLKILLAI